MESPHDTSIVNSLIRDLSSYIGQNSNERFFSATIMQLNGLKRFTSRGSAFEFARGNTLAAALVSITEFLTRNGFSLDFVLELQSTDFRSNHIDWYVEQVGRSLAFYLGYLWVTRCRYVGLPTTAPKGSTFELEIADLFAFSVNRYFHRRRINRDSEFHLTDFGNVLWGYFVGERFGTHISQGFPWSHFHQN